MNDMQKRFWAGAAARAGLSRAGGMAAMRGAYRQERRTASAAADRMYERAQSGMDRPGFMNSRLNEDFDRFMGASPRDMARKAAMRDVEESRRLNTLRGQLDQGVRNSAKAAAGHARTLYNQRGQRVVAAGVGGAAVAAAGAAGYAASGKKPSGWAAWREKRGEGGGGGAAPRSSLLPDYDGDEMHLRDKKNGGFLIMRGQNAHYLTDDEYGQYQRDIRRELNRSAPLGDLAKGAWGAALRGASHIGRVGLGQASLDAGRAAGRAYMAGARHVGASAQRLGRGVARSYADDAAHGASFRAGWKGAPKGNRPVVLRGEGGDPTARARASLWDRQSANAGRIGNLAGRAAYARTMREARDPVKGVGRLAVAGYHGAAGLGAYGAGRMAFGGRDRRDDDREMRRSVPAGDLAKAIVALPLAKRAALADAIEAGDAHTLSAILG